MTPEKPPICRDCARFDDTAPGWTCEAFDVIPMEIITSEFDHRKPHTNDGGLQFKPKTGR